MSPFSYDSKNEELFLKLYSRTIYIVRTYIEDTPTTLFMGTEE